MNRKAKYISLCAFYGPLAMQQIMCTCIVPYAKVSKLSLGFEQAKSGLVINLNKIIFTSHVRWLSPA